MTFKNLLIAFLSIAASVAIWGCATFSRTAPAPNAPSAAVGDHIDLQAIYTELGRAGGKVLTLAPQDSEVRMYVFRAGPAGKLGHNHVLSAPRFVGFLYLPSDKADDARFDLAFRLDELEIDNPSHRSSLGPAFSSTIQPEDIASTREHMLGADNFQADRFPLVRIHSLQISGELPWLAAKVQIQMHGQQRDMWIPLEVEGSPERLSIRGSFVVRQSDFGVEPYSLLGGLLSVRDEVVVDFKLTGS